MGQQRNNIVSPPSPRRSSLHQKTLPERNGVSRKGNWCISTIGRQLKSESRNGVTCAQNAGKSYMYSTERMVTFSHQETQKQVPVPGILQSCSSCDVRTLAAKFMLQKQFTLIWINDSASSTTNHVNYNVNSGSIAD